MKPNAKHKMDSRQIVPCLIVLSFFFVCFFGFFVFVLFFFFILLGDRLIKRGVKSVSNQASRVNHYGDHYSNLMLKSAKKSPERKCSACVVG